MTRFTPMTFALSAAFIIGLSACSEQSATEAAIEPAFDAQTQAAIDDIKRIADGDTVTFGDIMKIASMAGDKDNQKKLTCGALTAGAQMAAMAQVSGLATDVDMNMRDIDGHLAEMAAGILPGLENTQVSTASLQKAMGPVFKECMKYPADVVSGQVKFRAGQYAPK